MKKLIYLCAFFFSYGIVHTNAQTSTTVEEPNCYLKWIKKFEERGGEDVADGTYTDVIVTFRTGSNAICYNGKVEVKSQTILAFYIRRDDGSYEQVKKKMKFSGPVMIIGGVSQTMLTTEDELINVMFPNKIKPKKAGFSKAPEPKED
jgi:hypothetical protein